MAKTAKRLHSSQVRNIGHLYFTVQRCQVTETELIRNKKLTNKCGHIQF